MSKIDISNTDLAIHYDKYDDELPIGIAVCGSCEWISSDDAEEVVRIIRKFLGVETEVPESSSLELLEARVAKLEAAAQAPEARLLGDLFPEQTDLGQAPNETVLAQAVVEGEEVTFVYKGMFDAEPKRRYLEPSEINTQDGYVLGYDHSADDTRRFNLNRIEGPVEFA